MAADTRDWGAMRGGAAQDVRAVERRLKDRAMLAKLEEMIVELQVVGSTV